MYMACLSKLSYFEPAVFKKLIVGIFHDFYNQVELKYFQNYKISGFPKNLYKVPSWKNLKKF